MNIQLQFSLESIDQMIFQRHYSGSNPTVYIVNQQATWFKPDDLISYAKKALSQISHENPSGVTRIQVDGIIDLLYVRWPLVSYRFDARSYLQLNILNTPGNKPLK